MFQSQDADAEPELINHARMIKAVKIMPMITTAMISALTAMTMMMTWFPQPTFAQACNQVVFGIWMHQYLWNVKVSQFVGKYLVDAM